MAETVRIAGAGLAGMMAALNLARADRKVEVFEAKSRLLPSSGPHSEGVRNYRWIDALEELRSVGFDLPPFSTVVRTVRRSRHSVNLLRGPAHYLFLRGAGRDTVDQALYRAARKAGVRFRFGHAVRPEDVDILATGPPRDRANILGAGYTFSSRGSRIEPGTAYGYFDNDVAPGGYLAITPGLTFHSAYAVSWHELRYEKLLAMVDQALELPWIRDLLGTSRKVGRIHGRAFFSPDPIRTAETDGRLYVGEAGGFQDAVAGFGFRYAVLTGGLAAHALLEGRDYRALLRETFGREFQESFAFREKLDRATNEDYDRMVASLGPEISLEEYVRRRDPRGF